MDALSAFEADPERARINPLERVVHLTHKHEILVEKLKGQLALLAFLNSIQFVGTRLNRESATAVIPTGALRLSAL